MTGTSRLLVSPAAPAGELAAEPGPALLDVRWRLGGPAGIDSWISDPARPVATGG